jgi:GT2 family glycosyltransferase
MSFSIVIETENLASGGVEDLARCLDSLAGQSCDVRTAKEVWTILGGCLDKGAAEQLSAKYPWLRIHQSDGHLNYLSAKKLGAEISTGQIIVYADSDVAYSPRWLEEMLQAFERHPDAQVVFSDTRIPLDSPYDLAIQLTWMFAVNRTGGAVAPADDDTPFRLNNFAIRREAMVKSYFDDQLPLYRNSIRFWRERLRIAGGLFYRIPRVMALHLPPRGWAEWWHKMLVFGADIVAAADYHQLADGTVVEDRSLLRRLGYAVRGIFVRPGAAVRRLSALLAEGRTDLRLVPGAIAITIGSLMVQTVGMLISVFDAQRIFERIVAFEVANARIQATGGVLTRFRSTPSALPPSTPPGF